MNVVNKTLFPFYLDTIKIAIPIATVGGYFYSLGANPQSRYPTHCYHGTKCGSYAALWPVTFPTHAILKFKNMIRWSNLLIFNHNNNYYMIPFT